MPLKEKPITIISTCPQCKRQTESHYPMGGYMPAADRKELRVQLCPTCDAAAWAAKKAAA